MARPNDSEEARANRLASMTRATSTGPAADPEARAFEGRSRLKEAALIRRDRIIPDPLQPRTEFDPEALEQLAGSIKARGILQPVRVRWAPDHDTFVLVVGERRWRASGMAGLESIPCIVVDGSASPDDLLEDQLVENCLRSDLRPLELARSYQALMTSRRLSQRALADRLHVSPASVAKAVALLTLPEAIQHQVELGSIGPDIAYQLTKVEDLGEQAELAGRAVAGSVKREEIQARAGGLSRISKRGPGNAKAKAKGKPLPTERTLRTAGGLKVAVTARKGFDLPTWSEALRDALAQVEARMGQASDQEAA